MSLAPDDPRHGTANGYGNLGCRCDACRAAMTAYHRERGDASYAKDACECGGTKRVTAARCRACNDAAREAPHGTESRYKRCRCDECRAASAAARRRRRKTIQNPTRHGLDWVYRNGCRCDECREAWRLRQREIAASRKTLA